MQQKIVLYSKPSGRLPFLAAMSAVKSAGKCVLN